MSLAIQDYGFHMFSASKLIPVLSKREVWDTPELPSAGEWHRAVSDGLPDWVVYGVLRWRNFVVKTSKKCIEKTWVQWKSIKPLKGKNSILNQSERF